MGFSRQEYWSGLPFPSPENYAAKVPTNKKQKMCVCVLKHYLLNEKLGKHLQKNPLASKVRKSYFSKSFEALGFP